MTVLDQFPLGARVVVRGQYLDEELTVPLTGIVEDRFYRPDWRQAAFVVTFDHADCNLPSGGEFNARSLRPHDEG